MEDLDDDVGGDSEDNDEMNEGDTEDFEEEPPSENGPGIRFGS